MRSNHTEVTTSFLFVALSKQQEGETYLKYTRFSSVWFECYTVK